MAEALCEFNEGAPVVARLAWRVAGFAQQLHGARRVGAGPLFFRPAGGRQHNVREPRRLGEEDVLHGEEV